MFMNKKFFITLFWSLLVLSSYLFVSSILRAQSIELAKNTARANYEKDLAFREWATSHGGIYVPVDENRTPPSPYLKHMFEQNIKTPSGRELTLMNPAYMLRQMMNEYAGLYGTKAKITSLNPINPDNAPDAWESAALDRFNNGIDEYSEIVKKEGVEVMRFIKPMRTTKGCRSCHTGQGYKVGEISGGISVSVPMNYFYTILEKSILTSYLFHLIIWIIGLLVIAYLFRQREKFLKEQLEYTNRLKELAHYDSLTSLPNRAMFFDYLEKSINMSKRDEKKFAVMFLDLDNFKIINDSHGHHVGDKLLKNVSERMNVLKREYDIFARIGGDEFLFLIFDESASNIAHFAQRLVNAFELPFKIDENVFHISGSVGISLYPKDGETSKELLQNADSAMYKAKDLGKNNYQFFTKELNENIKLQMKTSEELRKALKNDEFVLYYQPKIDSRTDEMVGMEALIRWNRPGIGLVMPSEFVWIAEESGFINDIGTWVLKEASRQTVDWKERGFSNITVSVNVSANQFKQRNFIEIVEQSCLNAQKQSCIEIELTESLLMDHADEILEKLLKLQELNIKIAIDDFGTGYSSLSYLKRFPVQTIKIDKSFVDDITINQSDLAISQSIIALAKAMNMSVVAEGVETKEQIKILSEIGCNIVQGYYYSKPISAKEVEKFFKKL